MTKNFSFSIIIPVYNTQPIFLKECLDSIYKQKYNNYELIIVNDCSTNKSTIDYLNKLKEQNKEIKIIDNSKNIGLGPTRNVGFRNSSNELIFYIDSDDLLPLDSLNKINFYFNKYPDIDFLNFEFLKLEEKNGKQEYIGSDVIFDTEIVDVDKFKTILINTKMAWQKIYSRNFLLKNNIWFIEKNLYSEDTYYNIVCLSKAKKFVCKKDHLYIYRMHDTNMSKLCNNSKKAFDLIENVSCAYDFIKNDNNYLVNHFKTNLEFLLVKELKTYLIGLNNFEKQIIINKFNNLLNRIIKDQKK